MANNPYKNSGWLKLIEGCNFDWPKVRKKLAVVSRPTTIRQIKKVVRRLIVGFGILPQSGPLDSWQSAVNNQTVFSQQSEIRQSNSFQSAIEKSNP